LSLLCCDKQPVDEVRLQPGLGGTGDDHHLIDIGDDHVLPVADRAAQRGVPRLDPHDDPLARGRARIDRPETDPVAGRHHVALIGGERLQQPPGGALIDLAVFVADLADQPVDAQHPSRPVVAPAHVEAGPQRQLAAGIAVGVAHHDGPLAALLVLADAFFLGEVLVLDGVGLEVPRPIDAPGAPGTVLAEFGADLPWFDHNASG
jgi:hypothetical protein